MKKRLLILCVILGLVCVGCGDDHMTDNSNIIIEEEIVEEDTEESIETKEETTQETLDENKEDEIEKNEEYVETEDNENTDVPEKNEDIKEAEQNKRDLFAKLKNREFYFSSGAGGWRTIMHIDQDGGFSGEYSDSDMGSIGEGYPDGTYYVCNFKGEFTKPIKVNEYTYSVGIANISYEKEPGTEEIIDGMLYCYSEPYGIEETNSLLFYIPGTPLEELPQEYLDWVRFEISEVQDGKLSFYGIYNEKKQNGFSSYEILDEIDEMLRQTEENSNVLKTSLENDPLSQLEMNEKSYELYQVWDKTLNTLWSELKNTLAKNEFETILNEQRAWIIEKESAVEKAGAEVEGGSMAPLVRNMKAAEITEKRVFELYELLN